MCMYRHVLYWIPSKTRFSNRIVVYHAGFFTYKVLYLDEGASYFEDFFQAGPFGLKFSGFTHYFGFVPHSNEVSYPKMSFKTFAIVGLFCGLMPITQVFPGCSIIFFERLGQRVREVFEIRRGVGKFFTILDSESHFPTICELIRG